MKSIKPATINSYWRKLCPEVVHDFIGFTTEVIKEILKEMVDMAEKCGEKGFKICVFFLILNFIFKLYKIVLVLPNIKMNLPQVYMCSPS